MSLFLLSGRKISDFFQQQVPDLPPRIIAHVPRGPHLLLRLNVGGEGQVTGSVIGGGGQGGDLGDDEQDQESRHLG